MARRGKNPSRRPTKKFRSSRSSSNIGWYLAIAACLSIVVGVAYLSQRLIIGSETDETTLCHTSGAINASIILLDLTDPLNPTQQLRLKTFISNEIATSNEDTMVSIGVVSEDPSRWGALFSKCKPATGEAANGLYQNPMLIEQRYRSEFLDPVNRTLDSTLVGVEENQSPIMEALQSLVSQTSGFTRIKGRRKIIIASDMLQHSETLSFYRGQGWDYFEKTGGAARIAENLSGVDIEILRIPRTGPNVPSKETVEGFWTRYFDRQGSLPPSVSPLGDL